MLLKLMRKRIENMQDPLFGVIPDGMNPELKELVFRERSRYKLEQFFRKVVWITVAILLAAVNLVLLLGRTGWLVFIIPAPLLLILASFLLYRRYKTMTFTYNGGWVRIGGVVRESD